MAADVKTAVVMGGAGGLGQAVAARLAARGDRVAVLDLSAEAAGRTASSLVTPVPGEQRHVGLGCDLRSPEQVAAVFDQVTAALGLPDVLVNSGGIREIRNILTIEPEEWQNVIAVNLTGTFLTCREFVRRVVAADDGADRSIVNIASVAGTIGIGSRPAYCASKHGVIGLSRNLATDLGPHRIRVNVVAPGTIKTAMTARYYEDDSFVQGLSMVVPLGSGGTPGDVGDAVEFLTGDSARFVTGIVLPVDGGWSAEKSYSVDRNNAYYSAANSTGQDN